MFVCLINYVLLQIEKLVVMQLIDANIQYIPTAFVGSKKGSLPSVVFVSLLTCQNRDRRKAFTSFMPDAHFLYSYFLRREYCFVSLVEEASEKFVIVCWARIFHFFLFFAADTLFIFWQSLLREATKFCC